MSIYQELLNLINTYIYGGVTMSGTQALTADLIATIGCIALVALPFFVCWRVIQYITQIWM